MNLENKLDFERVQGYPQLQKVLKVNGTKKEITCKNISDIEPGHEFGRFYFDHDSQDWAFRRQGVITEVKEKRQARGVYAEGEIVPQFFRLVMQYD